MTQSLNFLVLALVVVALPVVVLRFSGLKGLVPLVVVQIMVGIALGPSVFGRVAPGIFRIFINPASLASLSGIGSIAVLVFGLITGLHLGPGILRDNGRMFSVVAAANVMVPTALGCLAGFWILARHPGELPPGISSAEFAAAVGICCAGRVTRSFRIPSRPLMLQGVHRVSWRNLASLGETQLHRALERDEASISCAKKSPRTGRLPYFGL